MTDSAYDFIELVGTSTKSWEDAARVAVEQAAKTVRDLRVCEVKELDMQIEGGKVTAYRARIKASFRVEKAERKTARQNLNQGWPS